MEEQNVERKKTSGMAIAGFILAICGFILAFIPIINTVSYPLGVAALILGIIAVVKKGKKGLAIAALVIAVVCLITATAMKISVTKAVVDSIDESVNEFNESMEEIDDSFADMTGENTEELLGTAVEVNIGTFVVEKGEYFDDTKLEVTVKNLTDEKASFNIQIEAVNADGSRITNDYIYANDLSAGQSQTFELFTFVSSDDIEALQNATFNIVEISKY